MCPGLCICVVAAVLLVLLVVSWVWIQVGVRAPLLFFVILGVRLWIIFPWLVVAAGRVIAVWGG